MNNFAKNIYPFTAIVGQEKMKKGLILNAINPKIGGILIKGEKGTAKSTAVRALSFILPEIKVIEGCRFNCSIDDKNNLCIECIERLRLKKVLNFESKKVKVIELPLSSTEDRIIGTIDLEYAIKQGKCKFDPGILAKANKNIIYVDEINLLDDHIVDVLLDSASMGVNIVERENVSYSHPSEFVLIGTMNPEEGDLRPQLLDRFGLCVEIEGSKDVFERVKIIKRREEFDKDPLKFKDKWETKERELSKKIEYAREILSDVSISEENINLIASLCSKAFVSGHRADIIMERTSRTIAAFNGKKRVSEEDIYEAAELVLLHRALEAPPQDEKNKQNNEEKDNNNEKNEEKSQNDTKQSQNDNNKSKNENRDDNTEEQQEENNQGEEETSAPPSKGNKEFVFSVGQSYNIKPISYKKDRVLRKGSGKRSRTKTPSRAGRYIRSTINNSNNDLALDATLRVAAPYQVYRNRKDVAIAIETSDIRNKVREKRIGNFLLFLVDASGSMGAKKRMVETKGAILSLLLDAYQKRDRIGMIAFKGEAAETILPPTNSVDLAYKLLEEMPTGGKTPLSAGLDKAYNLAKSELFKNPNISPLIILISDGKANVSLGTEKPLKESNDLAQIISEEKRIKTLVVDVEKKGFLTFGLAKNLAENLGAQYYKIDDLKSNTLLQAVRNNMYLE
ncbi:putative cobaltochelatase [Clostridium sp. LCP25S3_F10]|uniref:putative cobaltochelatase n=1 Tax=Clostridium sp. LCP25S3_F10 TaxID=3438750 RepID=UPI003F93C524